MATVHESIKVGKLIVREGEGRDAVHIAIAPMMAGSRLVPGERIRKEGADTALHAGRYDCIGIVDPYLTEAVEKGDRFWCFLLPTSVTSLRHVWTHPAFEDEVQAVAAPAPESEAYLNQLGEKWRVGDWRDVVVMAKDGKFFAGDDCIHDMSDDDRLEMWSHIEAVSGQKFDDDKRENATFRCAC